MLHASATWPGLTTGVRSFSYTCSHGSGAGVMTLVIPEQDLSTLAPEGDLSFSDGVNGTVTFRDCRIDSANPVPVPGGRAIALQILDRRWAWRFGGVSGWYNQRDPNPDPRPEDSQAYKIWEAQQIARAQRDDPRGGLKDPGGFGMQGLLNDSEFLARPGQSEFIPGTERTPIQLMAHCLGAMYERAEGIEFGPVPNDSRPAVDWQAVNPAQALQSVGDQVGCRLIFRPCRDGVLVAPLATAKDRFTLPALPTISDSPSVNPADPPDRILLVGGPVLVSDFWRLQAVGMEASGEWKPIDKLSYKPKGGWGKQNPGQAGFDQGVTQGDSGDVETSRALTKQFVWRTFRLSGAPADLPDGAGGNFDPATPGSGGDLPADNNVKFRQPVFGFPDLPHARTIELLDREFDIELDRFGQLKSKPARIWADSYKQSGDWTQRGLNREFVEELPVSVSVNEWGLVTTDQPLYAVTVDPVNNVWTDIFEANVFIRTSARIRDPATWAYVSGVWEYRGGKVRDRVPPEIIRRPEFQVVRVIQRQMRKKFRVVKVEVGPFDLDTRAAAALAGAAQKYTETASTTRVYAGLHAIDPDRAIQQVSWSFGVGQAPTTTVSVGTEHDAYVPTFPERRRTDAVAAMVTDEWVSRTLGRWQDSVRYNE